MGKWLRELRGLAVLGLVSAGLVTGLWAGMILSTDRAGVGRFYPRERDVLLVGDSVILGYRQRPAWFSHFPRNVRLMNYGQGGFTAAEVLQDVVPQARADGVEYDAAVVFVGTNDALRGVPPGQYRDALRQIVAGVPAPYTVVVGPVGVGPRAPLMARYRRVAREVAQEYGCGYVDLSQHLPARRTWFADPVHPNGQGGRRMYAAIADALDGYTQ